MRLPLFAATLAQLCERTQAFFQQEQISRKPLEFIQHLRIGRIVTQLENLLFPIKPLPMRVCTL